MTPAIIRLVETLGDQKLPTAEAVEQYDPLQHDVFKPAKRKKRKIIEPIPNEFLKDADGKQILKNGQPIPVTRTRYEDVNRIAVSMQQLIVSRRAAFINAGNMTIVSKPKDKAEETLLAMIKRCLTDNKMNFKLTEIAERKMSELQCAMLWYSEDVEKGYWGDLAPNGTFRMRMRILSPLLGDRILPVFDSNGKLVYFARAYKASPDLTNLIDFNNPDVDLVIPSTDEVERMDIYSDSAILHFEMEKGVWALRGRTTITYGGLPVIYFSQPKPEWANVQHIIDRIETLISNFADTNDANGSPILFAKGIIKSMPAKGESAKVINVVPQISSEGKEVGESDLRYVTWDRAPEAIKLELETHLNNVHALTDTPDISTKGVAGLHLDSGVAFDRAFMGAHLGAMKHTQGNFGEGVQRMLNFLKKACIAINTSLKSAAGLEASADFPLFRINDERENVDMLIAATGGEPLLSRETAVGMTGLVQDAEAENKLIDKQRDTLGKEIDSEFKGGEEKE